MLRVTPSRADRFWRVEDSLIDLGAVRTIAFFARNSYRYSERWKRYLVLALCAFVRLFLYATSPVVSCRVLHFVLRGISRDRLDVLGREYFEGIMKPRLKRKGVQALRAAIREQGPVVLVSQGLDHVIKPLAEYLQVEHYVANRLDFRNGFSTGRLLTPIVHSRGGIARLASRDSNGEVSLERLSSDLGMDPPEICAAVTSCHARRRPAPHPYVYFRQEDRLDHLSVEDSLSGKHMLMVGVTGFIGKVWLAHVLRDLPTIGKIHLLIRKQKSTSARQRFEKMISESPVFEPLHKQHGDELPVFIGRRIEIHEGDVSKPGLGLDEATQQRLGAELDVVVNSGGLTDFNPDLRNAMNANVESTIHMLDFIQKSDHAALLHLSTCYVAGDRDGRIPEELEDNYSPNQVAGFQAESERQRLLNHIHEIEETVSRDKARRDKASSDAQGGAAVSFDKSAPRYGQVWARKALTEAGRHRSQELGWPNAYAFTKSLAESLIASRGADLPIAVVRPAIVETSLETPFAGWNEGINTSAPLSYLLGTTFRQLPANGEKCLDIIPVDMVCRGMTLVAAALVQRRHQRLYHMATSVSNPCNILRTVELTSLAHRQHYREQGGKRHWWKARMDAIPVSKSRYERLSAPKHEKILGRMRRFLAIFRIDWRPLQRAELAVGRITKLLDVFEPFILHNEHVFEATNINSLSNALPQEERERFEYKAESIDWRHYWIHVHVPGMRRWCYPLIEGRKIEATKRFDFRLPALDSPRLGRRKQRAIGA